MCFFALAALLQACSPVGRSVKRIGAAVHTQTVEVDRRIRGYLSTEEELQAQNAAPRVSQQGYCYKTLAEIECYKTPIAGEEERLVGKQENPPSFAQDAYPYPAAVAGQGSSVPPAGATVETPGGINVADLPGTSQPMPDLSPPVVSGQDWQAVPEPAAAPAPVVSSRNTAEIPAYRRPRELIPVFEGLD